MDIAAFIVSIVAIIIAILVALSQNKRDHNLNQRNLEAVYFNEIYKEYLIKRIPNARKYIHIDMNGLLKDTEKIRNELNNIRQDSLYYLYNDEVFYNQLKEECQKLEDYLVRNLSRPIIGEEQTVFYSNLQKDLKEIYRIVNVKFLGRKKR